MCWLPAVVLLLSLPLAAAADGMVYPTAEAINVTIPDQRALIHYSNGVERLVIETRFTGAGTNFAWVVPVPSPPVIEPATTGLFPTLQYLFQPRIVYLVDPLYLGVLAGIGVTYFAYLVLFVRPTGRLNRWDVAVCLLMLFAMAAGISEAGLRRPRDLDMIWKTWITCGGVVLGVLVIRLVRNPPILAVCILGAGGILLILASPGPATASSKGMSAWVDRPVSILDRKLVGIFDTTTIASRDPNALQTWLRTNGFAISTESEPVIASYIKDGWVFVAAKIRRDRADPGASTPHPLSFIFRTHKPVYPMRLTGVANGPVSVDLYVFGPSRAEAPHFQVERCVQPAYPTPPGYWHHRSPETPTILHPLLRRWVDGAPVATRLTGTLKPADMRQDVWLDWVLFSEKRSYRFSHGGAWTYALNWTSGALAAILLAGFLWAGRDENRKRCLRGRAGYLLGFTFVLLVGVYLALPKIQVRLVSRSAGETQNRLYRLYGWSMDEQPTTLDQLRKHVERALANRPDDREWSRYAYGNHFTDWDNGLTGGSVHDEDSPGNFVIRQVGGHLEFVAYDGLGAAEILGEWPLPAKAKLDNHE